MTVLPLSEAQAGPYLRALAAGLHALAPAEAFPPLAEALLHLALLDPQLSGPLLRPYELHAETGMPAWTWLERGRAEALLARTRPVGPVDELALERAARVDPELVARTRGRAAAHLLLQGGEPLPMRRLSVRLRRQGPTMDLLLVLDRISPEGLWIRASVDLSLRPERFQELGFRLQGGAAVQPPEGLLHLLLRHADGALCTQARAVEAGLGGSVTQLGLGTVGPFWTPLTPLPAGAPEAASGALVLHLRLERLAADIAAPRHLDPWLPPPPGEEPPRGLRVHRERRLAASPQAIPGLIAWSEARGARILVEPLRPPPGPGARAL